MVDQIFQQIGSYKGLVDLAALWSKVSKFFVRGPDGVLPIGGKFLGGIGLPLSTYALIKSVWSIWDKPSWGGALGVGMSALGMATSMQLLFAAMSGIMSFGIVSAVIGVVSLIKWLTGKPSEETAAEALAQQLPVIWSAGPVLFVAAGTAALLMGWPSSSSAPMLDRLTVPQSYVTRKLGAQIPVGPPTSPTVLVEQGTNGNPTRVIIVSPGGTTRSGTPVMNLDSYTLGRNMTFVSGSTPPHQSYVPFFIYQNGKALPNPDIYKALGKQDALLRSILSGGLSVREAMSAMQIASAASHYGVSPTSGR